MQQRLFFVGTLAVVLLAAANCGDDTPVNSDPDPVEGTENPCIADSECGQGRRCNLGLCVDATCQRDSDCPSRSCRELTGICDPVTDAGPVTTDGGPATDGGPGVDGGPTDGGAGQSCVTKYDCAPGKICKNQQCTDPAADLRCTRDLECPRGTLCDSATNKCIIGCTDNRDCDGSSDPMICDLTVNPTYKCAKCDALDNPCPSNKSCVDLACVTAIPCNNNGPCGDLVCTPAGFCGNCTGSAQCGDGKTCFNGHCGGTVSGCTDDATCQSTLGPKAYCNSASPRTCAVGQCTNDSHCNVALGEACDPGTHTCSGGGSSGGPCTTNAQCGAGGICVSDGTTTFCTVECSASANFCLCPNAMTCAICDAGSCFGVPAPIDILACLFLGTTGVCIP